MPNNQDDINALALTPQDVEEERLRNELNTLRASLKAPTPREQELEAQNKALWELVGELREAIEDCLADTARRAELGLDAETTIDEEDGTVCYPWGNSQNVRLQTAIQKAKEAKV